MDGPPREADLPLPKRPLCSVPGCRTASVHPWIAGVIAFVTVALIIYFRLHDLELTYQQLEERARESSSFASPVLLIDVLRHKFPYYEWLALVVVALIASVLHGVYLRHKKYASVILGAAGIPGALITAMVILLTYIIPITGGQ